MNHTLIGRQVGKFRVTAALAEGGALDVYKGVQAGLDREVVIQVLPPEFAADPVLAAAFRRASQRAARLSHPNIVALYDSGHAHGVDYFVTEFLKGGSLEERVEAGGPLSVERALAILADVLKALAYAHEKREVHGDLQPSRVRFDHRGNAIVTGFGRVENPGGRSPDASRLVPVAPEVLAGGQPTARSDLYQAGALLYWMLSGRPATVDRALQKLEHAMLASTVTSLDQLDDRLPEELARYVTQLLDPDPSVPRRTLARCCRTCGASTCVTGRASCARARRSGSRRACRRWCRASCPRAARSGSRAPRHPRRSPPDRGAEGSAGCCLAAR